MALKGWLIGLVVLALAAAVAFLSASQFDDDFSLDGSYNLTPLDAPRMAGLSLTIFANVLRVPVIGPAIVTLLMRKNKFAEVRSAAAKLKKHAPLFYPVPLYDHHLYEEHDQLAQAFHITDLGAEPVMRATAADSFAHWTSQDYIQAYRRGDVTPTDVARALIAAVATTNAGAKPLNAISELNERDLLEQAAASTERYQNGHPIGPLDGVPVGVKEEIPVRGYRTGYGTSFLRTVWPVATEDALPVALLRKQGALLVGGLNMHEIGLGVTGHNARRGVTRNPHGLDFHTGGSSSGSAAAAAAGLFPITIGADGGGSIRNPSSLNGIFGLKASFARIPSRANQAWSVTHVGPMSPNIKDVALAYAVMAGADHEEMRESTIQPPPHVMGFSDMESLREIRIGVFKPYFEDASPEVVSACRSTLKKTFEGRGVQIVEIDIPMLNIISRAHGLTILSEMATFMERFDRKYFSELGEETRVSLSLAASITARDYIAAQEIRSYAMSVLKDIFKKVDVIVTPSTAITAPRIQDDALLTGDVNTTVLSSLMRYVFLGNFLGLPALSCPIGKDSNNLPIGFQVMGDHWSEHLLLRLGHAISADHALTKPAGIFVDVLGSARTLAKENPAPTQ
eukprot:m.103822 g.103822  ORF g.103822 m.103822 type:complete len:624 (+) comp15730_c0_seq5:38-1909(+)